MAKNKTTKKFVKPTVIVDVTECKSIADVYAKSAETVLEHYCSISEADAFINKRGVTITFITCDCPECTHIKKPNVFKRFWNWITRK